MTQADLAKAIGLVCQQSNISKLERTDALGSEYTVHFAKALGVDPVWLAMGEGSPERNKTPLEQLPESQQQLLLAFLGLTRAQQERAIDDLAAIAAQNDALVRELTERNQQ